MNGVVEVRFFKILFMILICFASVFFVSCSTREGVDMSTDRMAIDGLKQLSNPSIKRARDIHLHQNSA